MKIHPQDVDDFVSELNSSATIDEVAYSLNVSRRTIQRWIASGRLAAYKPSGRVYILRASVRRFVEESAI